MRNTRIYGNDVWIVNGTLGLDLGYGDYVGYDIDCNRVNEKDVEESVQWSAVKMIDTQKDFGKSHRLKFHGHNLEVVGENFLVFRDLLFAFNNKLNRKCKLDWMVTFNKSADGRVCDVKITPVKQKTLSPMSNVTKTPVEASPDLAKKIENFYEVLAGYKDMLSGFERLQVNIHEYLGRMHELIDNEDFQRRLFQSTVLLHATNKYRDSIEVMCSGFKYKTDVAVTAAHCLFDNDYSRSPDLLNEVTDVAVAEDGGRLYEKFLWRRNDSPYAIQREKGTDGAPKDLAVIVFGRPIFNQSDTLAIVPETPLLSTCPQWAIRGHTHPIGASSRLNWEVDLGGCTNAIACAGKELLQFDFDSYPGNSGGAILNDRAQVFSLTVGAKMEASNPTFGIEINAEEIDDLVTRARAKLRR